MPKRSSTAAQRARRAVKTTGAKYTAELRRTGTPDEILHAALRAAGLTPEVARMDAVAELRRQIAPLIDRADQLSALIYEGHGRRPAGELAALQRESNALWDHVQGLNNGDLFWEERQVLYAAHAALVRAGAVADRHTRRLISAASGVLDTTDDGSLTLSDIIRCPRHYVSAPSGRRHREGTCQELTCDPDGPDTPLSRAARAAAALLGDAARVPFRGDEEWTHCAELINKARITAQQATTNTPAA